MNISKRAKEIISLKHFNERCTPEYIEPLALDVPEEEVRVLRMMIRRKNEDYVIPAELEWCRPLIERSIAYQNDVVGVNHSFCYITVRNSLVDYVTDDEWHVDGFSTRITHIPEQNYVWCDSHPTQYVDQELPIDVKFDPIKHNLQTYFQKRVKDENIHDMEVDTVYCVDPYVIHRRRPNIPSNIKRCFIRVSFCPIEITDCNNTINPNLSIEPEIDGVKDFRDLLLDFDS